MVWKKVKPLFYHAHTRKAKEINQQANCKLTIEKKLKKDRKNIYNHILDEERLKNNPLKAKSHKVKSK